MRKFISLDETFKICCRLKNIFKNKYTRRIINVIAIIPFVIFIFTEDFNLQHILNVSSKEINFRIGIYNKLANHWYYRFDIESPAKYVNMMYKEGDVIILD